MYFNFKLIFVLLLAGCTSPSAEKSSPISVEEDLPVITLETDSLMQSVDITLEVAEEAIKKIKNKKKSTNNTIKNLKEVVNKDIEIVFSLEQKLVEKDSLINLQLNQINNITNQIITLESLLEETKYNSKYEKKLLIKENNILKEEISNLKIQIQYLDSLVQTNRRLKKNYKF